MVVDTGGRVDQEWTKNPLYNVLLVRNLLQKELNQFVFVNQLVVGTSNFLEELLDVSLEPLDLHHGYFKWVQLVSFELVEEIAAAFAFFLNNFFELLLYLLIG